MARSRPSLPVLVLAAVALVAGALIAFAVLKERGTPTGASSDAALNQKIIDRLDPYPGARQTRKFVRESYGGYGGGLLPGQSDESHMTTIVYSLPAKTRPNKVADFYRKQLPGWEAHPEEEFFCETPFGGRPCFTTLTRGDAMVSLSFNQRRTSYSLGVDARGASRLGSFSD